MRRRLILPILLVAVAALAWLAVPTIKNRLAPSSVVDVQLLRIGMTAEEVREALGEPTARGFGTWKYGKPGELADTGLGVYFNADNRVSGSTDLATGEPVTPPLNHHDRVYCASFSPDGRRVVTASGDKTARVWDVSPDERRIDHLVLLAQLLASHRIDPSGVLETIDTETLRVIWDTLKSKYPSEFVASRPDEGTGERRRRRRSSIPPGS